MLDFTKMNEAQQRAVTHPDGPAMVLAGPGSGKTFLVINRVLFLIEYRKIPPDNILVITFTKAAALSMQRRFKECTGGEYPEVWFGTFHSFFYHILKMYASYDEQSIVTTKEKQYYLKETVREFGLSWEESAHLLEFMNFEQKEKPAYPLLPDGVSAELFELIRESFCEKMLQDKKLDFDDMAVICERLLRNNAYVLAELRNKYRYLIIDEYQDTNSGQEEIIRLLAAPENNLMVVGDDDQSIYGFRGSDPDRMKSFPDRYPGASLYFLEMNYRSSQGIVDCALRVIEENKNRFSKNLRANNMELSGVTCIGFSDFLPEFEYIAKKIEEFRGKMPLCEMAVIARSNRELEKLSEYLGHQGYLRGGKEKQKGMLKNPAVKEVIHCLEFIVGRRLHAPKMWKMLGGDERKRLFLSGKSPYVVIHFLHKAMGGVSFGESVEAWKKGLEFMMEKCKAYHSIHKWLDEMEVCLKETEDFEPQEEAEKIRLLTMHASKGLEFEYVCLININEGRIPGKRCKGKESIEEERRLLYVGMTRAKKVLDILYLTGTADNPRLPSRFLKPILPKKNSGYSASSTNSSNSTLSKNSSNASATASYSSSSSM